MDDEIMGNLLIPLEKKDLASYNDFLRRIKTFEQGLTYDKFLEICGEFDFKAKAAKEAKEREQKYTETDAPLQDLFKELKIKEKKKKTSR